MGTRKITSLPTIRRLPSYLLVVRQALEEGAEFISGTIIANELELEPIQVRKDLAITGIIGKPRVGYPARDLITAIEHFLGWDSTYNAIIVGTGNLGSALLGYPEFKRHGLNIIAAFDTDKGRIGKRIHGTEVFHLDQLTEKVRELSVKMALLTVPSPFAQPVANQLVDAGIIGIWNFTNVKLKLPPYIVVQKEDLSSGYAVLSVKMGVPQHHNETKLPARRTFGS